MQVAIFDKDIIPLELNIYNLIFEYMNSIFLALPFTLLACIKKQSMKNTLLSIPATFCMSILFTYLPIHPTYFILFALSLCNALHIRVFNLPLPLKSLLLIKHLPSLKDSIRKQFSFLYLFIFLIGATLYSLLLTPTSIYCLVTIPFLFFCPKKLLPYPFWLLVSQFKSKAKKTLANTIQKPENEVFYKYNPTYPLEKFTKNFTGEKLFSIPGDKPHVVFVYLESFRESEVGKVTPYFDKYKEQGIYFSNFYSNASQTFKAMFATMYGIPPCFGSDFVKSSSPVLTLQCRGMPNFFKEAGYDNIFIKAGSNIFNKQGEFLKNHLFDKTFDKHDIKKRYKDAYGTSWGVHDEFLYKFLLDEIKTSSSPLFINSASITNHHPFVTPDTFKPKFGSNPFEKTTEYTDFALHGLIKNLKKLDTPIHLYILGDHGFPKEYQGEPRFNPSLEKDVTKVPLLILPLNCGDFTTKIISSISSQIDLLPTVMDIYGFFGINSSLGSSLVRKKQCPVAYLLNETIEPYSGVVTTDQYKTFKGYHPLYTTLSTLYEEKRISNQKQSLVVLDLSGISICKEDLQAIISDNQELEDINLESSPLIYSLDLEFPPSLNSINLNNNILIEDTDLKYLPNTLQTLQIKNCKNLTDHALTILSKYKIHHLEISANNFSTNALSNLVKALPIKHLIIENGENLDTSFFLSLKDKEIKEFSINGSKHLCDLSIKSICNPFLEVFLSDNCKNLTDETIHHFTNTSVKILHLQDAINISDKGLKKLSCLQMNTFYISNNPLITEKSIKVISVGIKNLFCIDCENLPYCFYEKKDKKVYFLKNNNKHLFDRNSLQLTLSSAHYNNNYCV